MSVYEYTVHLSDYGEDREWKTLIEVDEGLVETREDLFEFLMDAGCVWIENLETTIADDRNIYLKWLEEDGGHTVRVTVRKGIHATAKIQPMEGVILENNREGGALYVSFDVFKSFWNDEPFYCHDRLQRYAAAGERILWG